MSHAAISHEAFEPHATAYEAIIMCPNCGSDSDHHRSNLLDETLFRKAAREAKMLREFGHVEAAGDVLTRLAVVKIINFLRMKWKCQACGAQFDE